MRKLLSSSILGRWVLGGDWYPTAVVKLAPPLGKYYYYKEPLSSMDMESELLRESVSFTMGWM